MKKILNTIIVIAGFLLLIVLALAAVNDALAAVNDGIGFMDASKFVGVIDFLRKYGALIVVGALVFVNLIAKSVVRIIFLILFLLACALYVFATGFPLDFANLFGAIGL